MCVHVYREIDRLDSKNLKGKKRKYIYIYKKKEDWPVYSTLAYKLTRTRNSSSASRLLLLAELRASSYPSKPIRLSHPPLFLHLLCRHLLTASRSYSSFTFTAVLCIIYIYRYLYTYTSMYIYIYRLVENWGFNCSAVYCLSWLFSASILPSVFHFVSSLSPFHFLLYIIYIYTLFSLARPSVFQVVAVPTLHRELSSRDANVNLLVVGASRCVLSFLHEDHRF